MFASAVVVAIILLLVYYYGSRRFYSQKSKDGLTVPGLEPTSEVNGNCGDIENAGSLHDFLQSLHSKFGPIASFWYGQVHYVSIASPKLFKEHQSVFDRPVDMFLPFKPLIGEQSIQYANGSDGQTRRKHYDKVFAHNVLPKYCSSFQACANTIEQQWLAYGPDDQIDATKFTHHYAVKCALWTLLGDKFKNEEDVIKFKDAYTATVQEMEREHDESATPSGNSARLRKREEALKQLRSTIKEAIDHRIERNQTKQGNKLLDVIIEHSPCEERIISDAVTYAIGGYHTTANSLSWGLYFIATHNDVQDKMFAEIKEILGENGAVDETNFADFRYMFQVIDESIRCSVNAPFAARFQDCESELGGYKIPANTPVIHALGVVLQDEALWPEPLKFDPERFSDENRKNEIPHSFPAFGFAGKRKCPGYKFTYWESVVFYTTVLRRFQISCCNEEPVKRVYGFTTHPSSEIWIKITKRK